MSSSIKFAAHQQFEANPQSSLGRVAIDPVGDAARSGLTSTPKSLPAWLFYDAEGSRLFECITLLPEYYLTRTERAIFAGYADGIIRAAREVHAYVAEGNAQGPLRLLELGAGSASKTGILLAAAVRQQGKVEYLPVDVSETAIDDACVGISRALPEVELRPQVANYVTDALHIPAHAGPTLALYIGSSIGNFKREEAISILRNLRAQLQAGDTLLLGTDLVKDREPLLAAYNDSEGVTEAFNLNVLRRLNLALRANFDLAKFHHEAVWNAAKARIEMHLRSTHAQSVRLSALNLTIHFTAGETIHTENSYKFTSQSIGSMLSEAGFRAAQTWNDDRSWFAVTLAAVA